MVKLVIMIVCCTFFAVISQRRDESLHRKKYTDREQFFFSIMALYMIFFAGLRTSFNDTTFYLSGFTSSHSFPNVLANLDWRIGMNPGYKIYVAIIRSFTSNQHIFLLLTSGFILYTDLWFIRKYTKNFGFSIFLFFLLGYYAFTMAAIKQTMATALALIAIDRLVHGKKLLFVLLVLLGMTFHPYVFLYLLTPLLLRQVPWKKGTWVLILATIAVSYSFNLMVGTILDITDVMGEGYSEEVFVGEGINFFRVMVYFVPVVISFLWRRELFEDSSKTDNLFVNYSIICSMVMFIGLLGNANMFARMAMYFEPPIYIALPWMLHKLKGRQSGMFLTFGAYASFPIYFYYQMVVTTYFDAAFYSITLGDFFNSLFH